MTLKPEQVRAVAKLARLEVPEAELDAYAQKMSAVLEYMDRLRSVRLEDVEPMTHVGDVRNRLDADEPGAVMGREALMRMAPAKLEPFVRVPKVLGDGGGA